MNSLCLPRIIELIKKHKIVVVIYIVLVLLVAGFYGYKKYRSAGVISPEMQTKIEIYERALGEYENSIQNNNEAIEEKQKQIDLYQSYIDNSILMKIDPEAVLELDLQYGIEYNEGTDANGIAVALTSYIRDGMLQADILKALTDEENKYLGDVISFNVSNPNVSIKLKHYSETSLKEMTPVIDRCLADYLKSIVEIYGEGKLVKTEELYSVKAESSIIDAQNAKINQLREAENIMAKLTSQATSYLTAKTDYIENNKPDSEGSSPSKEFIKGCASIVIIGIVILLGILWCALILQNVARSRLDIERAGLEILGMYGNKGFIPDAMAIALNIKLIADRTKTGKVHLTGLVSKESSDRISTELSEALEAEEISVTSGDNLLGAGEEIKKAATAGCCVILVQIGQTRISDMKAVVKLCRKFGIIIIGAIAV